MLPEKESDDPKKIAETFKLISELRGVVLDNAVLIELLMNGVLARYFCKEKAIETFREYVLEKEFFTFAQKIKIFSELQLHKHPRLRVNDADKYDKYCKKLWRVNEIRNAFAHGFLMSNAENHPVLKYRYNGQIKELEMNDAFQKEFYTNNFEIQSMLTELISLYMGERQKSEPS